MRNGVSHQPREFKTSHGFAYKSVQYMRHNQDINNFVFNFLSFKALCYGSCNAY